MTGHRIRKVAVTLGDSFESRHYFLSVSAHGWPGCVVHFNAMMPALEQDLQGLCFYTDDRRC